MQVWLEVVEFWRQRDPESGDVSEAEEEPKQEGETPVEEVSKFRLLRALFGSSSRLKPEIYIYDGNLKDDNLID